jgi:hypothetical protein
MCSISTAQTSCITTRCNHVRHLWHSRQMSEGLKGEGTPGVGVQDVCHCLRQLEQAAIQHRVQLTGRPTCLAPQRQQHLHGLQDCRQHLRAEQCNAVRCTCRTRGTLTSHVLAHVPGRQPGHAARFCSRPQIQIPPSAVEPAQAKASFMCSWGPVVRTHTPFHAQHATHCHQTGCDPGTKTPPLAG